VSSAASTNVQYHMLTRHRLLYGLSFPMSEEAQKDDFVIPVRTPLPTHAAAAAPS
jgi:hypothetical protein